jgi:hypothetical protein
VGLWIRRRPLALWQIAPTDDTAFLVMLGQDDRERFSDEPKVSLPQLSAMLMSKLSTDERNLLRYYAETARILHGAGRGVVHQHLLSMGYIEERTVNMQDSVVVVTHAGRMALGFRS